MSPVTNSLGQQVKFNIDRARKAEKTFVEWISQNPQNTLDIADVAFSIWGYGAALHCIDSQAAQIEALKEKLLEKQCRLMPAAPGCYADARMEAARQQLAKEMPEVDW
jgi:hypothetical protein